jgi:hypothetical protein
MRLDVGACFRLSHVFARLRMARVGRRLRDGGGGRNGGNSAAEKELRHH